MKMAGPAESSRRRHIDSVIHPLTPFALHDKQDAKLIGRLRYRQVDTIGGELHTCTAFGIISGPTVRLIIWLESWRGIF